MKQSNIISLCEYRPAAAASSGFDHAAFERRALRQYRRAGICQVITTVVENLMSIAIGACVMISTLLFFTIL